MKKKIIYLIALGLLIISCGGVKTPAGESEVFIPCQGKEFTSDKNYFRAFGSAVSNNPNGAIQDAEQIAAQQLALNIERKIKVVTERYSENITDGMKGEFTSVSNGLSRQVANTTLSKVKTICTKTTKDNKTGMYKYYTSIEISTNDIFNELSSKIENDTKSKIRLNRENFRAIFDEELSN